MQEKNSKKSAQEKSGLTQQIAAHHKSIIGILLVLFVAFIVSVVAVSFGGGSGLQGSFQRFANPTAGWEVGGTPINRRVTKGTAAKNVVQQKKINPNVCPDDEFTKYETERACENGTGDICQRSWVSSGVRIKEDNDSCRTQYGAQELCQRETGGACILLGHDSHGEEVWYHDKDRDGKVRCADVDCRQYRGPGSCLANPRTSTESSLSCTTIYLNPEECFVNNPDYECAARSNPLFGYMTDKDGDGLVGPDDPDCRRYVN